MAALNAPPAELKENAPPLLRLKKERFNAALNEAKARVDLYNRGLTRIAELIPVGRAPIADLKRLMDSDPKLGFAFRPAVEKVKSGKLTAEDIIARLASPALCPDRADRLP
jgi:hypothetical protein